MNVIMIVWLTCRISADKTVVLIDKSKKFQVQQYQMCQRRNVVYIMSKTNIIKPVLRGHLWDKEKMVF